jgi:hypothetical protein
MINPIASLTLLLSDAILPELKAVQVSQSAQITANDRLEQAIEDLRAHFESQFALLSAQLTTCRAELAATKAALKATHIMAGWHAPENNLSIH